MDAAKLSSAGGMHYASGSSSSSSSPPALSSSSSSSSSPVPPASPVKRPAPTAPFHPPSDTSTYRDLLLFEERLKMNAEMLRRRRRRYSVFLWSFVSALILMTYRLLALPPTSLVLLRGLQAAIAVVFITLTLFFASGMYEEKIRYAHSYINHSNKALRPLNMYLNVRRAPTSILALLPLPAALRSAPPPLAAAASAAGLKTHPHGQPSGKRGGGGGGGGGGGLGAIRRASHIAPQVMAQIPPASNPRGELIFSSRVDHHFEEGYKRYRAAFERRREERSREDARAALVGRWWWVRWWKAARGGASARGLSPARSAAGTLGTPPASRRGTPPPGVGSGGAAAAAAAGAAASAGAAAARRESSPGASSRLRESSSPETGRGGTGHARAESYSFVNMGPGQAVSARART